MNPELAAALVAAQAEMPAVKADASNPHFKSKFVSLDHLIASTRPVLNRHGLAIIQAPANIDGQPALETQIIHKDGASVSSLMPLILAKDDMQGMGAAITYARRYAWAAALGIAGEDDDDGESAVVRREDPKVGKVAAAKSWGDWTARMAVLLATDEHAVSELLREACAGMGIPSLASVSGAERRSVFVQANRLLVTIGDEGPPPVEGFPWVTDERLVELAAQAFDGAVVTPPARGSTPVDETVDENIEWPEEAPAK